MVDEQYLIQGKNERYSVRLGQVVLALSALLERRILIFENGFYALSGRKHIISQRKGRMKLSLGKLRRLRKTLFFARLIPFVRMIGVTGRLSMKNAERGSDWDVFVVLENGRVWTGRTLSTLFFHIIGRRRWGDKHKDRICLNHFVTNKSLTVQLQDLFSAREYSHMIPIFGTEVFQAFQYKNMWIRSFLPQWQTMVIPGYFFLHENRVFLFVQKILERVFSWKGIERYLATWQKKKIEKNPKTKMPGGFIRADNDALIFLPKPQGPKAFEQFQERIDVLRVRSL